MGYITYADWGVPMIFERGAKSEMTHKWADWLHNHYRLGGRHRSGAVDKISSHPQLGGLVT